MSDIKTTRKLRILVTGAAGFIGFHVARRLLAEGHHVTGFDNLNPYYDVSLKHARLAELKPQGNFAFVEGDLAEAMAVDTAFKAGKFTHVVNLAAQAGVRYSLVNPKAYGDANLTGFLNILEACRHNRIEHLVYASSSSVYGANTAMPFSIHDNVDHPLSLYAATKKANELMAHSYAHMFGLPSTGLRFFTVYGPWGRPDMAMWLFADAILKGEPITLFNHGKMKRDFTYVDDIVESIARLVPKVAEPNLEWDGAKPDPGTSRAPYRVYNIGNNSPVELMHLVATMEKSLGIEAKKIFAPIEIGDVPETYADVDALMDAVDFKPSTPLEVGVEKFIGWFRAWRGNR
ncbi:MAG: NAD-dependent epimerase [Hyphomicrobiales bacterium]|jgi:UDP-glucuronate 4-epimerase|nr:NAD-dependent epimerase [Hyphomicrobiales bacterium]